VNGSFARFCVVTGLSLGLNFGTTIVLHEVLGLAEEAAYALALLAVFATNFVFLRAYIFAAAVRGSARRQFALYALSAIGFRVFEYFAFLVLHTWLGIYYLIAMAVIQTAAFIGKYLYYGRVVFRDPIGCGPEVERVRERGV
jgi:putative flippase GtrA